MAGVVGNIYTYQVFSSSARNLKNEVASLRTQVAALAEALKSKNQTGVGNISLSELYESVKDSVVLIHGYTAGSEVSGSGFIYNLSGLVVTNYHVVEGVESGSLTVTFSGGNSYLADILGEDPYVDLAVLAVEAPVEELKPLPIVSSSLLKPGDLVIAVGNPYGLTGTMTTGIVSQLGRTISEPATGGYPIAGIIQISTPINPGNSGGPLLNSKGQVVGITTAIITESQGIGFAIPSDAILNEIDWLADGMEYKHPWIGVLGMDMTYEIADRMNTETTYGWLIVEVMDNSPAQRAGLEGATHEVVIFGQTIPVGGDIILAINGTGIRNGDDVSSYLEGLTSPGRTIDLTVERSGEAGNMTVSLVLGERPPPS